MCTGRARSFHAATADSVYRRSLYMYLQRLPPYHSLPCLELGISLIETVCSSKMSTSSNSALQGYVYKNDVSKVGLFCEQLVVSLKQSLSGNMKSTDSLQVLATRLLDRAFGESVTGNRPGSATNNDAGYAVVVPWMQCKQHGGWLRSTISSTTTTRHEVLAVDALATTSNNSNSSSKTNTTAITLKQANIYINKYNLNSNAAKLVALFSANDSELMYMFYTVFYDFEFKLSMLPRKTQFCLLNHPACETIYTNSQSIYSNLFKNKGAVFSNNGEYVLKLQPFEYFLICLFRYPSVADDMLHSLATNSTPANLNQAVVRALYTKGPLQWLHGSPFLVLFYSYLEDFIVSATSAVTTENSSKKNDGISQKNQTTTTPKDSKSDLFIRLAVDILIESNTTIVKRDFDKVDICRAILYNTNIDDRVARGMLSGKADSSGILSSDGAASSGSLTPHPLPEDVVVLDTTDYAYWTIGSLQCIYLLVAKALASPTLCEEYRAAAEAQEAQYSFSIQGPGVGLGSRGTRIGLVGGRNTFPCSACPQSVDTLQQPLFDMLRVLFSRGDSVVQCSSLVLAVEVWMLYIQPWRCHVTLASGVHATRSGDKYTDKWLPYVAANLHFYTTLFVSFIKCSSRLDFRTTDESGMMYYNLLESVSALFTDKGLRQAIDGLVSQMSDKYAAQSRAGNPKSAVKLAPASSTNSPMNISAMKSSNTNTNTTTVMSSLMGIMINQHHALFPDRSIDLLDNFGIVDVRNYETLRSAIIRLVQTHYLPAKQLASSATASKDVFATIRNVAFLIAEGMAGNAPLATHGPSISQLESTIQKLCDLATLGPLAAVASKNAISSSSSSVGSASSSSNGERDLSTGKLTPLGKERILSGKSVSKLEDYLQHALQRDYLDAPLRSDEMPDVASLMIYASNHLNERFDLPKEKASKYKTNLQIIKELIAANPDTAKLKDVLVNNFRFNLRPFARLPVAILTFAFLLFQFVPALTVDVLDFLTFVISGITPFLDEKTISQNGKVFIFLFAALRVFCRVQGVGMVSFLVLFSIGAIAKELA